MNKEKQKYSYSKPEKITILISLLVSLSASYSYFKNISLSLSKGAVSIGQVEKISNPGELLRQKADEFEFSSIPESSKLFPNDTLMTDANTHAFLELKDGQKFEIPPSTLIKLDFGSDSNLTGAVEIQIIKSVTLPVTKVVKKYRKPIPQKAILATPPPTAAPTPEPTPEPTPVPVVVTRFSPQNGEKFYFTPQEYLQNFKAIPFHVELDHEPAEGLFFFIRLKGVFPIQRKSISLNSSLKLKKPGIYRWQLIEKVRGMEKDESQEKILLEKEFEILPELEAIELNALEESNNKILGITSKKNFGGFLLSWKPKFSEISNFTVKIYKKNETTPVLVKSTQSNKLLLNRNNLILDDLDYKVEGSLKNGFIAVSSKKPFKFDFRAPEPKMPPNNSQINASSLIKTGGILIFTWAKTNYTQSYDFELSQTSSFESVLVQKSSRENLVSLQNLKPGTYFWRVRSKSTSAKGGLSEYSQIQQVTITP